MSDESTQEPGDTGVSAGHEDEHAQPTSTDAAAEQSSQDTVEQSEQAGADDRDWKAEAKKWRERSQKHERNARGARDMRQELDQLREQVANADVSAVEAAGSLATERLHTRLARAGIPQPDAASLIEHIDPMRLLEDGAPSDDAIDTVASSLTRPMARASVDTDQGQRSAEPTESADDWLRRKARQK